MVVAGPGQPARLWRDILKNMNKQKGFSFIEVTVAASFVLILVIGSYYVYSTINSSNTTPNQKDRKDLEIQHKSTEETIDAVSGSADDKDQSTLELS